MPIYERLGAYYRGGPRLHQYLCVVVGEGLPSEEFVVEHHDGADAGFGFDTETHLIDRDVVDQTVEIQEGLVEEFRHLGECRRTRGDQSRQRLSSAQSYKSVRPASDQPHHSRERVVFVAIARSLAAPGRAIDLDTTQAHREEGAVVVEEFASSKCVEPQFRAGAFARTAFAEEEDGAPFVDDSRGMDGDDARRAAQHSHSHPERETRLFIVEAGGSNQIVGYRRSHHVEVSPIFVRNGKIETLIGHSEFVTLPQSLFVATEQHLFALMAARQFGIQFQSEKVLSGILDSELAEALQTHHSGEAFPAFYFEGMVSQTKVLLH